MTDTPQQEYFATCPKHIESLLAEELRGFGCGDIRETVAGVYFSASLSQMYRVCLWSRLANRILMPLAKAPIVQESDLYTLVHGLHWEKMFAPENAMIVDFTGTNQVIRNTQFGAQRSKDAVVDRFQQCGLARPSVAKDDPDVRINVHLAQNQAVVSLDMSGESLHRRGYRARRGAAPLKENLAAAILLRCGLPGLIEQARATQQPLRIVDPMCGSGTFLIEAAMLVRSMAPGLLRNTFSFTKLKDFDSGLWQLALEEARDRRDNSVVIECQGYDSDQTLIALARQNVHDAGLEDCIQLECKIMNERSVYPPLVENACAMLICNPPYGERMSDVASLREVYRTLGQVLKKYFVGFRCGVFTGNRDLGREMRMRIEHRYKFFNGPIASELLCFAVEGGEKKLRQDLDLSLTPLSEGAQMVANRLMKNARKLAPWITREAIQCYRLYDADMPEYAAAIDIYGDCAHVQEYQAPKSIDERQAEKRFNELVHAVVQSVPIDPAKVYSKLRKRNKGAEQYERLSERGGAYTLQMQEGKAKFWVNLSDYLDTGVFLDHRPLRLRLYREAQGKSFLNLFCYTATATVQAALGGAARSVSVDMSNTYLKWAGDNFKLNNINPFRHTLVRDDCVGWLAKCREGFDLIMLDPPTFSNSKRTETVLDIQRDHVSLIKRCCELLNPGGVLYFSTNHRQFKFDSESLAHLHLEDISEATIDVDFQRNSKIHRCWRICPATK